MTTDEYIIHIKKFLIQNGVDPFWASSAINWIRTGMAGNNYWLTELSNPQVKVSDYFGMVDKFTVDCIINTEHGTTTGKLIYIHDDGHKVQVVANDVEKSDSNG